MGDVSWPEHVTIFTVPVRVAVQHRVPLVVWGENSQNEYGGPAAAADGRVLDRRWLEEFGGLIGLRVSDLVGRDGIESRDLIQYTYPTDDELAEVGVTGLFLGYYMPWDGASNALMAQAHGFESWGRTVEGALVDYENLDNLFHGIHDYFKFLKFGFGRATDHACMQVRRGRISRVDAVQLVRQHDGKYPHSYLGTPLDELLDELGMTRPQFDDVCDRFTNRALFRTTRSGELLRDAQGNLAKINDDNVDDAIVDDAKVDSAGPDQPARAVRRARGASPIDLRPEARASCSGSRSSTPDCATSTRCGERSTTAAPRPSSPTTPPISRWLTRSCCPGWARSPMRWTRSTTAAWPRPSSRMCATRRCRSSACASGCSSWPRRGARCATPTGSV